MSHDPVEAVIARAEREGVITPSQSARLREMAGERAPAGRVEAASGLNPVTIAYSLGALLVLFASGWFLFDRWNRLGAAGVLLVALAYAAILVALAAWLRRRDFVRASGLSVMLAVSLTPLATWAILDLAGRWPSRSGRYATVYYEGAWEAWQWLLIELATILVGLLVLRWRRIVAVTYPIAVALWGVQYHLARIARGELWNTDFDRWAYFTCGAFLLVGADLVERWQWRGRADAAPNVGDAGDAGDVGDDGGDYAGAFWAVGFLAFTVGYGMVWGDAGPWRHLLLGAALVVLVSSIYLRRRLVMAFGMLGAFGYIAWLTDSVFKNLDAFPLVLAGLGILMILATVWVQRRFPALVARVDASRGGRRGLPWSPILTAMLPVIGVTMLAAAHAESDEARRDTEFRQRLQVLRAHSHRYETARKRAEERARRPEPPPSAIIPPR